MLFPYEEYVKFFQYDGFSVSPRGLLNCGNRYLLQHFWFPFFLNMLLFVYTFLRAEMTTSEQKNLLVIIVFLYFDSFAVVMPMLFYSV